VRTALFFYVFILKNKIKIQSDKGPGMAEVEPSLFHEIKKNKFSSIAKFSEEGMNFDIFEQSTVANLRQFVKCIVCFVRVL
jgi:hypothetical protein